MNDGRDPGYGVAMWLTGAMVALAGWGFYVMGYHIRHHPSPDERYGCTAAQQAPNGECK